MSEGWTWAEARHAQRWCDGAGYKNGVPVCGGRAVKRSIQGGEQLCQRCQKHQLATKAGGRDGG